MQKILFTGARSGIINKVIDRIKTKYQIIITVHTESQLKIIKKKYKNYPNIKCLKLDITNKKDIEKIKKLDIDILVSNASIGESGSITEIDINKIRNNFETNVFSGYKIIQIFLNKMIKKEKGKIIIISSLASQLPIPFLGPYCASKASVSLLAKTLNLELKILKKNIKICLIEPGLYNTGFNKLMIDKKYEYMNNNSFFKDQINHIKKAENLILKLFEKNNLNQIVNKITEAINKKNPKFIYRVPYKMAILTKIYNLFS